MQCTSVQAYDPRWDQFVRNRADGTFFHLWKWRDVLKDSFGYEPFYLCVEQEGQIRGVLPLFLVKSLLFGKSLVGVPVGVYGGVIADTAEAEESLVKRALDIATGSRARYLEIRGNPYADGQAPSVPNVALAACKRKDLYFTFISEIDPAEEVNFSRIPRKQRRMVRQGQKQGLKAVFDNNRLRDFYEIYAESVRNLGTPVFGYGYFQKLLQAFRNECGILLIEFRDKPVAAVLSFYYKDQVMPYYGGALKDYFHLAPNDFMYWELMSHAAAKGCRIFDFGRSKEGTGPFNFKRHWGFEPHPLPYWYYPLNGHSIPDTSPLNPKLQWAIRVWRNLPLKLTMALGPRIVRHLP
jgi:FemAB-related protein (PEP-CTERM system-associated)